MTLFFIVFLVALVGSVAYRVVRRRVDAAIARAYRRGLDEHDRQRFLAVVRNQPDRHYFA